MNGAPPAAVVPHDLSTDAHARGIPSPLGRKVLAFEFVVLLEYFLAPMFLGVTNYAGPWSTIGTGLFVVLAASLILFLFVPLWPRLRLALAVGRNRWIFHAVWATAFVAGLFLTNLVQFPDQRLSGPILLGQSTIYTPLGAWPSLTVYVPSVDLYATLNVEQPAMLLFLALLSSAAVVLARVPQCASSDDEPAAMRGRRRWLSLGGLAPLGFVTGCPTCFPAYFALLALVAPGVAGSTYVALPLVPWLGLAGLFYLAGLVLVTRSIRRVTGPQEEAGVGPSPAGAPAT